LSIESLFSIPFLINLKDLDKKFANSITGGVLSIGIKYSLNSIFKDIEKSGGFLNQLKEGTIQRKIKENAQKEQDQFDKGEINLIETNKITKEHLKENSDLQLNNFIGKKSHKTLIIPIIPKRLSEKLEQKMLKNEA